MRRSESQGEAQESDLDRALSQLEHGVSELRKLRDEIERDRRRAAFFRRLGVRTPKLLFKLHGRYSQRLFRPNVRRRDRFALAVVRWWIDRFEMLEHYGRLW